MKPLTAEDRAKLISAGLIQMPEPAPTAFEKKFTTPREPRPAPKFIIAPVDRAPDRRRGSRSKDGRLSHKACLLRNICCLCRTTPAIYYGPNAGYGYSCQQCADAKNEASRAKRGNP